MPRDPGAVPVQGRKRVPAGAVHQGSRERVAGAERRAQSADLARLLRRPCHSQQRVVSAAAACHRQGQVSRVAGRGFFRK